MTGDIQNVIDSDGTLIFSHGILSGGSALTHEYAIRHKKPCLHLDLEIALKNRAINETILWLERTRIQILNVATRESFH